MNERFNGKIAIVTGAASGIGRAIAGRFFEEGASVFAVDRNPETLAKLPQTAERWQPHLCDVAAKGASHISTSRPLGMSSRAARLIASSLKSGGRRSDTRPPTIGRQLRLRHTFASAASVPSSASVSPSAWTG